MNDRLRELGAVLESHSDELWELQNAALQLTVEGADRQVVTTAAAVLTRLRDELVSLGYERLVATLEEHLHALSSEELQPEAVTRLFTLVEAMGAAARGVSSRQLAALVDGTANGSNGESDPAAGDTTADQDDQQEPAVQNGSEEILDSFEDIDPDEIEEFCAESREHIQDIELHLVELERTGAVEHVNEVFRAAHSIKGGAQYLGLEATATVSHRMEAMLDRIRAGELRPEAPVMAVLLKGLDCLAALTRAAEQQDQPGIEVAAVVKAMDALLAGANGAELATGESAGETGKTPRPRTTVPAEAEQAEPDTAAPDADGGGAGAGEMQTGKDRSEIQLFADDYSANMTSVVSLMADADAVLRDPERAAVLTRNLHTIKGIAGFVGLGPMEELADSLEALISRLRRAGRGMPDHTRAPVSAALNALDSIFEQYVDRGGSDLEIDGLVQTITELAEQEGAALAAARRPLAARAVARSDHPLAGRFRDLLAAYEQGVSEELATVLDALEDSAMLHGFEELAGAAHDLARMPALPDERLADEIERLAALLPREIDAAGPADADAFRGESFEELLLSVPGIGPKKRERIIAAGIDSCAEVSAAGMEGLLSVRGINIDQARMVLGRCGVHEPEPEAAKADDPLAAELSQLMLEDEHDRELVGIYLETTGKRIEATVGYLADGEAAVATEAVSDMIAAASYMGYHRLAELLGGIHEQLTTESPDTGVAVAGLQRVAGMLSWIDSELSHRAAGPGEQPDAEAETAELQRIFSDSAREHLLELSEAFTTFAGGMTPDLLAALQHHLTCLEATATNIGNDPVTELSRDLRGRIEDLWMEPETLSRAAVVKMIADITTLFAHCRLKPPHMELPPVINVVMADDSAGDGSPVGNGSPADPNQPLATASAGEEPADSGTIEELLDTAFEEAETATIAVAAEEPAVPVGHDEPVEWGGPPPGGGEPPGGDDSGGGDDDEPQRGLVEPQATLRVDTEKIDDLMNMAAELVVNRSSLMVLGSTMRDLVTRVIDSGVVSRTVTSELRSLVNRFDEETNDLGRVSNQLQEGVMRMRMVPVKMLFGRVPRLVRDLARRSDRAVRVSFSGEETELDKTVIEQLSDPLVHLIRNAVGHGIEPVQQRRAAGKPEQGHLSIAARHEGNMVILEVEDDGRGINREQVRECLVASGASSSAEALRLSDRELLSAIFLPGLTTASEVSDVSGRGVGLDVVKSNIESLGGQVEVFSEPGRWCRFVIRIPLTMAIMQALLVRVEDEVYSIPVSSVIQTVNLTPGDISTVENQEVITVRDQVIPLIRIEEVFTYHYHLETGQLGHSTAAGSNGNGGNDRNGNGGETAQDAYVVVLQGEDTEIGIVVDSVIGGQDIVIKSLEDELVDARGIAGGAILGDGTVTLILDVAEIQKMAIDSEHFQRRRLSEAMRRIERFLVEQGPDAFGPQPS